MSKNLKKKVNPLYEYYRNKYHATFHHFPVEYLLVITLENRSMLTEVRKFVLNEKPFS